MHHSFLLETEFYNFLQNFKLQILTFWISNSKHRWYAQELSTAHEVLRLKGQRSRSVHRCKIIFSCSPPQMVRGTLQTYSVAITVTHTTARLSPQATGVHGVKRHLTIHANIHTYLQCSAYLHLQTRHSHPISVSVTSSFFLFSLLTSRLLA